MSQAALTIGYALTDDTLQHSCNQWLKATGHRQNPLGLGWDAVRFLREHPDGCDVIVFDRQGLTPEQLRDLRDADVLVPAVVIGDVSGSVDYHEAEVHLPADQLEQLSYSVDACIARFLRQGLRMGGASDSESSTGPAAQGEDATPPTWQLAQRLRERLGYLGVFYKRDPSRFLRSLPPGERAELFQSLERTYRDLLLSYFRDRPAANQALESFVNTAFFSDLPITKTVEIHMNLIDRFGKQLKLEGHNNDFLQDYRLALLDVMAHLCEMYRRSVPPDAELGARRRSSSRVASEGEVAQ
ncbi:circadian clock protein KaiA [Synechococcus sp. RSCCF101]|uniref:circadian clock protein KaiA n=1 Tax=Synechococcus sp. RSCCF101 TaxID=2511069 RepID=UPI0012459DED|nr:circadian clock protein KaiA [Synechococcus sp. RSCCF101]QEY33168.1 circadian clock protein KaiA [Synechococcus sp. RSCCF101]